jgi:hypothetical protein
VSKIIVYTCILNGFDNLRPPLVRPEPDVRFICYTNVPMLPDVDLWEFRPAHLIRHAGTIDLARSSRIPKILPHLVLPKCDYSIWHDGNFQLQCSPHEIISRQLRFEDWSAHRHPARDCVYKEAEILVKEKIGTTSLVEAEIERYRGFEYPACNGLWANGLIIRRHTEAVRLLNEDWWELYMRGCERDQLSFPVARHLRSVKVNDILEDVFNSPFMRFGWHAAWKDKADNVSFRLERERIRERVNKLSTIAGSGDYSFPRVPNHED